MFWWTHQTGTIQHNQWRAINCWWRVNNCWWRAIGYSVWIFFILEGRDGAVICWGNNSHAYQIHWTGDHINADGSGSDMLEQLGRENYGPHHLNGALILGQFWGNTCYHLGWVISMEGLCYFHKPWWGWWLAVDGVYLFWLHLLGCSCWLTHHLGGSWGLWPSFTVSCQKQPSSMNPMGPAMGAFPWGGLHWLGWCDPHPIGWLEVFQDFFISKRH